ncbi:aldo/keto reductase [Dysosmobacter welbionis]|uniref:aldo/keto reductase n=1 Tax=Dysosmobacter welbionis TaxID=2093857 RepID=UPI0032BF6064
MKKIASFLCAVMLAGTVLTGCGTSTAPESTGTEPTSEHTAETTTQISGETEVTDEIGAADASASEEPVFNLETRTVTLNNGIEMPILGIGTFNLTPDECENSVYHALLDGYRLIDTANAYMNERAVGRAIKRSGVPREEIFVTTKLWVSEYERVEESIDETLARLDLEYIDLLLLHQPYGNYIEGYRGLEQAVADGKVRAIGLSNFYQEKFDEIMEIATITPALIQNEMNPFFQQAEMKEYVKPYGTVLEAWYPLGGRGNTQTLFNDPTIVEIAENHGKTSAQIVLRWHMQAGNIAIPGSSNPDHILENISIFDFELTDEEMEQIATMDTGAGHYDYTSADQEQEERFTSSTMDFDAQE